MAITIELDDAMASQLRSEAAARQMSLEEFGRRLLAEAMHRIQVSSNWRARNQRRVELIRKSTSAELTAAEQAELDDLQAELYERMETADQDLLDRIADLENTVMP
ncbi:MAG: hypothetical protein HUU20_09305 [Pirellulales bacterium]|nr:hypothetical protein [Pirellulales bacterium]